MRTFVLSCTLLAFVARTRAGFFDNLPLPDVPDLGGLTGDPDEVFGGLIDQLKSAIGPNTVDEVDLESYTGRWYQMFTSIIPLVTFERNAVCVTADYSLNEDGSIAVVNANRVSDPTADGELNTINGTATVPDLDEPGQLVVSFDSGPAMDGDYWIVALGPVVDSQYQYSVVTEPLRTILFVLARNVTEFEAQYEDEVKEILKSKGFVLPWNMPIPTYQESDCAYAPAP